MTCEGKTFKCSYCGERFCPDCDLPPGAKDVFTNPPVYCGICLDINSAMHPRANLILDRLDMKRRNEIT